ncbi:MAG: hypothetical protein ABI212_04480 [Burkholderiaceae bacterium]
MTDLRAFANVLDLERLQRFNWWQAKAVNFPQGHLVYDAGSM